MCARIFVHFDKTIPHLVQTIHSESHLFSFSSEKLSFRFSIESSQRTKKKIFEMFSRQVNKLIIRKNVGLLSRQSSSRRSISELAKKSLIFDENDGFVMKSPYESISLPELTVDQYVWKNLAKWQNHVAICCGTTGRKYTYSKLRDHCAALAIRLRTNFKLEKNDIVAICLPNVPGK